ncbi:MAG: RHS repeat-associated core domain-containing protein, partial [Gemmatimonadaceae bacterium]
YDPRTGRFVQEDPIGLAGGVNLYGFAGADPVNYSDPFGLCPIEVDGVPCILTGAMHGTLAGAWAGAVVGGAGGTFILPGVGTLAGGGGGVVAGGLAGLAAGTTAGAVRDLGSLVEMSGLGDKIKRKITRTIETVGFIVGLLQGEPPPKKPDDEHKPPPPAPTSTKSLIPDKKDNKEP